MAKSTGIGSLITRTVLSGVKVATFMEKKRDLGSITTKMETRLANPSSAMENTKVLVSPIMEMGTSDPVGPFLNM
jgi:hypothetical protein